MSEPEQPPAMTEYPRTTAYRRRTAASRLPTGQGARWVSRRLGQPAPARLDAGPHIRYRAPVPIPQSHGTHFVLYDQTSELTLFLRASNRQPGPNTVYAWVGLSPIPHQPGNWESMGRIGPNFPSPVQAVAWALAGGWVDRLPQVDPDTGNPA